MSLHVFFNQLDSPFKNVKTASIASWLLALGVIPILAWLAYFSWVTIQDPNPLEYREGASQVVTGAMLNGQNPFSVANQPLTMEGYGIGYHLAVLPLAAVFGNTLAVHRFVSIFFIFLSLVLSAWAIHRSHRNLPFAIAGGGMGVLGLLSLSGPGAFPNAMGNFLFLAAVVVVWGRSFDRTSLVASALLSLLAFYTKPYFVLSIGIVASYVFLFVSKKKGIYLGLLFLGLLILTAVFVRLVYELYFLETVFLQTGLSARSFFYLLRQLVELDLEFLPVFICGLALMVAALFQRTQQKIGLKELTAGIDLTHFNQPFFQKQLNYFFYVFLCASLVIVVILGDHTGAYMTYLYQLMLPPFFLCLFQQLKPASRLALIAVPFLLFNMVTFCEKRLNAEMLQPDTAGWTQLSGYLRESRSVLNSPVLTSEMLRLGMQPVDTGQDEFYFLMPDPGSLLISPNYETVKTRGEAYLQVVQDAVRQKSFERILITEDYSPMVSVDLIRQTYQKVAVVPISFPRLTFWRNWNIEIWEPQK